MTNYEKTETSKVESTRKNQSNDVQVILHVVVVVIAIFSLTLSSNFQWTIIFATLTVTVLALICDHQFMKKAIFTAPAIVSLIKLYPVMGTAIVTWGVLIICLMHKPSVTIRILSCIVRKAANVISTLKRTVFGIVSFAIPVVKRTIVVFVTLVIPIFVSSLLFMFNFSAAMAIGVTVHLVAIVVVSSFNLRNEVYYASLFSGVIVTVIGIKLTSDDHDFDNSIVAAFAAILLIFLNSSFDLGSLRKITIFVATINIAIFATNWIIWMVMPTSVPGFVTQSSLDVPQSLDIPQPSLPSLPVTSGVHVTQTSVTRSTHTFSASGVYFPQSSVTSVERVTQTSVTRSTHRFSASGVYFPQSSVTSVERVTQTSVTRSTYTHQFVSKPSPTMSAVVGTTVAVIFLIFVIFVILVFVFVFHKRVQKHAASILKK